MADEYKQLYLDIRVSYYLSRFTRYLGASREKWLEDVRSPPLVMAFRFRTCDDRYFAKDQNKRIRDKI